MSNPPTKPLDDNPIRLFVRTIMTSGVRRKALAEILWKDFLDGKLFQRPAYRVFNSGTVHITPGAKISLFEAEMLPLELLRRHCTGQWDALTTDEELLNDYALKFGGMVAMVFSRHFVFPRREILIITHLRRKQTLVFLDEDLWLC